MLRLILMTTTLVLLSSPGAQPLLGAGAELSLENATATLTQTSGAGNSGDVYLFLPCHIQLPSPLSNLYTHGTHPDFSASPQPALGSD